MKRSERPTCVYFFKGVAKLWGHSGYWPPNAYKIGVSHHPKQRLYDCYGADHVVHTIQFRTRKGAHLAETWLHRICAPLAISGHNEWFCFQPIDIDTFAKIDSESMAFDFIEACIVDEGEPTTIATWQRKRRWIERYSDRQAPRKSAIEQLIGIDITNMKGRQALEILIDLQALAKQEQSK